MDNTKIKNTDSSHVGDKSAALFKSISEAGDKLMICFRKLLPAIKASNIIVLGMKGAGKTTLWHGLGGIDTVKSDTTVVEIPSFIFQLENGRRVKVVREVNGKENKKPRGKKLSSRKPRSEEKAGGIDIGGEDSYVGKYDDLIVRDSFVYYIADATKILDYQYWRRMRSDFRKIDCVVTNEKNKIGENHFGFKVLLSHYDEWAKKHPDSTPLELFDSFFTKMAGVKPDGPVRRHLLDRDGSILMAINLMDDNEIRIIKEDISKV